MPQTRKPHPPVLPPKQRCVWARSGNARQWHLAGAVLPALCLRVPWGKRAMMEPQMPGRSCCGYDTFLWVVLGKLQAPRNSLLPFNLLAPIVTVTYVLYLSPMPDLFPIFLVFNIQWKWSFDLKMSPRLSSLFSTSTWESKQSKLHPRGVLMSAIFLHCCVPHLHLLVSLMDF